MKTILILFSVLFVALLRNSSAQDIWTQNADFGGGKKCGSVGFSIDSMGYIVAGEEFEFQKDIGEYDPATNVWAEKAYFPGEKRTKAVGFSIGSKGYIGTGYGFSGYEKDLWEYDPATDTWTQKAHFPGTARQGAVGFSIGNKGYLGTGYDINSEYKNDFWEYDPAANGWTQKADFGGTPRWGAIGFSIDNKGYIGTGSDINNESKNDFWEYNPSTNIWIQKADFGGGVRFAAVGFSIGNKGYIGTGTDSTHQKDFWEYNPLTNSWSQKTDFGGVAREWAVGFSIGNKGYIGTGRVDEDPYLKKDFWEYTPECSGLTVYADADGDLYGDATNSLFAADCIAPGGYVYNSTDCNDANTNIHPGATEFCNSIDDNCNGNIDEGVLLTFYPDADGDTYGDAYVDALQGCSLPDGYVTNNTDCDDNDSAVNPGASEVCDGIDNNCNGNVDEGLLLTFYPDADEDNYGDAYVDAMQGCSLPDGYVTNNTDCDDNNSAVNPAATEVCDGIDNNCDGNIDEGLLLAFYPDVDGDSYGDAYNEPTLGCSLPDGYVTDNTDCDDNDASINPSSTEVCDNIDNNCNGNIDEGLLLTFYADADGDTYGNANSSMLACSLPNGYVTDNTDCDDNNPNVYPGAQEITNNGIDDNCNGLIDEFGVGIQDPQIFTGFTIDPNPAKDQAIIHFTLLHSSHVSIKVYDVSGKEIACPGFGGEILFDDDAEPGDPSYAKTSAGEHSLPLNTSNFSQGVYFVKMISDSGNKNQKLIVQ